MSKVFEIAFKLGGELTSSFKNAFGDAGNMMKTLGAAATALGGAAALTGAINQVSEMQDSLAKLSAQTGTFGAEMESLGDVAKNVFRSGYGESFDEVTLALQQVKQNMQGLDNGELERVTGNAMMLANTLDADVNEVTRAANNLMTNFGIDSEKAFDMMAKGAQNGLNFSNEMFDNLSEYAPLWADLGFSAEEMFGSLISGAQEGVYNLDYLNDMVKEFGIRLMDDSKKTKDAMGSIFSPDNLLEFGNALKTNGQKSKEYAELMSIVGESHAKNILENIGKSGKAGADAWADLEFNLGRGRELINGLQDGSISGQKAMVEIATAISEIENPMQRTALGVELFGTKFEDLGTDTSLAMMMAGESLEDFEGSMEKINAVRFDTFGDAVKGIGRILFMDIVYPLGEAVLPILNQFANYLKESLPGAIDTTVNILRAVMPPVLGLTAAFVTYRSILMLATAAKTAYTTILALGPPLLYAYRTATLAYTFAGGGMIGVITALRSGVAALNLTVLANPFALAAAAIVGLVVAFIVAYKSSEKFRNVINGVFASTKNAVLDTVNYISTVAPLMWSGLISSLGEMKANLFEDMRSIASEAMDFFGDGLTSKVGSIVSGFIESFKTGLSSLPGIISMIAPLMTTMALGFLGVSGPIGWLIGAIVSIGGFLFRLAQTNDGVASALSGAWSSLQTAFAPVMDVLTEGLAQFVEGVGPQFSETMSVISQSVTDLAPSFATLGATLGEVAILLLSAWAQVGTTMVTTVFPLLLETFQLVFTSIVSIVTTVVPIIVNALMLVIPIFLRIAQMVIPLLLSVVQMVFPLVLSIIQAVLPIVAQLLVTVVGVVLTLAQTVIPILLTVVQMVFPMILSVIQMVIPIIAVILQTVVTVLNTVVIPAINLLLSVVQIVFPYIQMIIQNALAIINGILQAAMALLKGDWEGAWNAIKGTAETIMNNIISFFKGINLYDVGVSIINGLINGIKSMGGAVLGAIGKLVPGPVKGVISSILPEFFADGGIVASPTLAWIGEGGDTEAVIPWNNSQRSKDLWIQTGQQLGMLQGDGVFDDMQQQVTMYTTASESPVIPNDASWQLPTELLTQTGQQLGAMHETGAFDNMQQQIIMQTEANDNPAIRPEEVVRTVSSNETKVIQLNYNPQYNVQKPEDLEHVKKHADKDKEDLEARLEQIERDKRRKSFGD